MFEEIYEICHVMTLCVGRVHKVIADKGGSFQMIVSWRSSSMWTAKTTWSNKTGRSLKSGWFSMSLFLSLKAQIFTVWSYSLHVPIPITKFVCG